MLAIGSAVAKGGASIFGSIAGHNNQVAQARARNKAMMAEYKQRLKIQAKEYNDAQVLYANKLGNYAREMTAADRAASRAFGIEQYNRSQRLKQAAFQGLRLSTAFAAKGGSAAASGKTGSGLKSDQDIEGAFVRNQNMIAQNLLTAEETRQYSELGIEDKFTGLRNRAYSQVAIAPQKPLPLLAPTQLSTPSTMGRNLGILNAGIGMATGIAGALAPNPGGGTNTSYYGTGGKYGEFDPSTIPGYSG